ncbi:uncharacterized protein [Hyperolius riggenbachi]|uniref:uncharacterized protein isoform X2 n=1 Tax=Hyperolius riggenbachi TaxID=752182 RepID=UPI0035A36FBD
MESVVQAVLRRARQEDGEAWLRDLLEPVEELSDFAEEMEEAVPASEVPLCAQSGDEEEPGPSDRSVSAPPPGRRASARKHQNTSQEGSAHKGGRRLQGANVGCRSAASQQGPAQGKRPCKKKGTSSPAEPVRKSLRSSAAARSRETQEQGVASALLQEDSVAFAGAEGARSQDRAAGAGRKLIVWILGHSYIYWAQRRAIRRPYSENLFFDFDDCHVLWQGIRGMKWAGLCSLVYSKLHSCPVPDVLVIHLGGNDLGKTNTLALLHRMRSDIFELSGQLPNTKIIYSEMVARPVWSHPDLRFMNSIRKRVNRAMAKTLPLVGGLSIRHRELEGGEFGLFRRDLVHLSGIGLDILNSNIHSAIEEVGLVGGPGL